MRNFLRKYIWKVTATPSFWGTVIGIVALCTGYYLLAGLLLIAVGYGGCGIALSIGVNEDRDPWRCDTVIEAVINAVRYQRDGCLWGLLSHFPQAIIGTIILVEAC